MYQIPSDFYFRLHHVRPRFKSNIENVLGYMAFTIANLDGTDTSVFRQKLSSEIRAFPGNEFAKEKTIQNWRTEISALFSMIQTYEDRVLATDLTKKLADSSNLREFFLRTMITFQYPGGFLKSNQIKEITNVGILFNPLLWLAQFFTTNLESKESYITDVEFCHCVLNDLRVTAKNEKISLTIERIMDNRKKNLIYDATGDVKRYALDILDYCVLAGILLKDYDGKFFLKDENKSFLEFFKENYLLFEGYNHLENLRDIDSVKNEWIDFVNNASEKVLKQYNEETLCQLSSEEDLSHLNSEEEIISYINTKDIGDVGESLALAHEKLWLINNDRNDLSKLVRRMPTEFAVGFDVLSRNLDATMKQIEVKTTMSNKALTINRVHLTPNEWLAAESHRNNYYIYRLLIADDKKSLWIIKDPVGLYKQDKLQMSPRNGADLTFDDSCYEEVELLEYYK